MQEKLTREKFIEQVLGDYKLALISRHASILGRKEVLSGKAKFGIFGDGKEIAQIALAKQFMPGDFRSGYYRDQTIMFAINELTLEQFFAQLYAHPSAEYEPASAGRQMNGHFATRSLDSLGQWKDITKQRNSSSDISPTASQMPRLLGLAQASKIYRENVELKGNNNFSNNGNEVAFGTIGNASSAEGLFWDTVNAGGVLMVPMAISIWDDGYGISVPNKFQITKGNLSEVLSGFEYNEEKEQGYLLYSANGWDYPALVKMYEDGIKMVRERHIPAIFHIREMTQPQGHSTSGSHERYKSKERLEWEEDFDCIKKMRAWMLSKSFVSESELDNIDAEAKEIVRKSQKKAWDTFFSEIKKERKELAEILTTLAENSSASEKIIEIRDDLVKTLDNDRRANFKAAWNVLIKTHSEPNQAKEGLLSWIKNGEIENQERFNTYLYSGTALQVEEIKPQYDENAPALDGREVLNHFFNKVFERDPRVFAFGEDVGHIGDVNQGLAGLQEKYGINRISDTGIREATIIGQGIGTAMRGLRPIAEIQYLDYIYYALQIISDDLSTLYYRTKGGQKAPLIIRTRGHRLEGIWHSGSPMGTLINAFRGIYICVPRNMTQAAGFYNTLLMADEPGLVIERLNAYRMKEKLPSNIGEYTIPLGVPEVITEGNDVTIVTYGACVDIALDAAEKLEETGISVEIMDVQTLLPFDLHHRIVESIKKTNRVLFLDEDVPGGCAAYMMQKVLEEQDGYKYLDSAPRTLTAKDHRPAYGTDGDYFSKPNSEDVFRTVYEMMNEFDPQSYPIFF